MRPTARALHRTVRPAGIAAGLVAATAAGVVGCTAFAVSGAPASDTPPPSAIDAGAQAPAATPTATPSPGQASPGASVTQTWTQSGAPARMIVIRPGRIDLVYRGVVRAALRRTAGPLGLDQLAMLAENGWSVGGTSAAEWISRSGSTVQLSAAVLLARGVHLEIGGNVRRVYLTPGTWIRGGSVRLNVHDVKVSSWDPQARKPMPATAGNRPFVAIGAGGRLDIDHATVANLGRPGPSYGGVTFGRGSTGSVTRTVLSGNTVGLKLAGSSGVWLDAVTLRGSGADGLVLRGDRATGFGVVKAEKNAGNGVVVRGPSTGRQLTGISASGNRAAGIAAIGQTGLRMSGIRTSADQKAGIWLSGCVRCTISGVSGTDERTGLAIGGAARNVRVIGSRFQGGAIGVRIAAPTRDIRLSGVGVTNAAAKGISISGTTVDVQGGDIKGSKVGVQIHGRANGIHVRGTSVRGGESGVTVARTAKAVVLSGLKVADVSGSGVSSAARDVRLTGGSVSGAGTGVALRATAVLDRLHVDKAVKGIHLDDGVRASGGRLDILAEKIGIKADQNARFVLTDSRVRAPKSLVGDVLRRGRTTVTLPPFPWLGMVGICALIGAVLLEGLHRSRQRRRRGEVDTVPPRLNGTRNPQGGAQNPQTPRGSRIESGPSQSLEANRTTVGRAPGRRCIGRSRR